MWTFPLTPEAVVDLDLKRRDIVAAWRPDVYMFDPAVIPTTGPLTYTVTIEGRSFSTTQDVGATLESIATALEVVLIAEQTIVRVFRTDETIMIYGALGQQLTVAFNANLELIQNLPPLSDGLPPGQLHVMIAKPFYGAVDGQPEARATYRVRRTIEGPVNVEGHPTLLSTTPFIDISNADVHTIIAREEDIP